MTYEKPWERWWISCNCEHRFTTLYGHRLTFILFRNHLQVIAVHVINDVPHRKSSEPNHALAAIDSNFSRRTGPLQCSDNCTCRCHARSLSPLIPESLTPYVGQLFISKQLLHPAFTPWNRCNVETCRGTYLEPAKVAYTLPPWSLFYGSFQTSSFETIHLSLNAYRTVIFSSPICQAIRMGDVHGVRDLFAKQQASIWDVDVRGTSILRVSIPCTLGRISLLNTDILARLWEMAKRSH